VPGLDGQTAFSLPFDAVIERIYATVGNRSVVVVPGGVTMYPFVQLLSAAAGSNTFTPMPATITIPASGLSGTVAANTMLAASTAQLNLALPAGTRILICGAMQTAGSGVLLHSYYMYYTGAIALRARG
jgi:hypothetical protein